MDWLTTSTLLSNLRDFGDDAAWGTLVDRFRRPVANFARRYGVAETDAEDVAQETLLAFAQAYRDGKYHRDKGRLSSWLFGIAYRQTQARHKRNRRRKPLDDLAAVTASSNSDRQAKDAAELWERLWNRFLMESCLARAKEEFRPSTYQAFALVVIDGRTPDEAAQALGVKTKVVYNAKHRVLHRVRELHREMETIDQADEAPGP